jgi:Na+/phosphate symporter
MNEFINTTALSCLLFLAILTLFKKSHTANTAIGYRFLSLLFIFLAFDFVNEVKSKISDNPTLPLSIKRLFLH